MLATIVWLPDFGFRFGHLPGDLGTDTEIGAFELIAKRPGMTATNGDQSLKFWNPLTWAKTTQAGASIITERSTWRVRGQEEADHDQDDEDRNDADQESF